LNCFYFEGYEPITFVVQLLSTKQAPNMLPQALLSSIVTFPKQRRSYKPLLLCLLIEVFGFSASLAQTPPIKASARR
jgi:hypothetical protein